MRIFCVLLLACIAGYGSCRNAPRQVVINGSPPPPFTAPTATAVPGLGFSIAIPGVTGSTWTATNSATLCSAMVNITLGYPRPYVICTANAVTTGTPGVSVAVGGYLYYEAWPSITATERQDAVNSRNLFVSTMKNNPAALALTFPSAVLNNTCDSSWAPGTANTASDTKIFAGLPLATCRIATLGLTTDPGAPATSQLQFPLTSSTTVDTWGIDNGKICAAGAGFISIASPKSVTVGTTLTGTNAATAATLNCATTGVCTLVTGFTGTQVLSDIQVGQTFTLSSSSTLAVTGCASSTEQNNVAAALISGPGNPRGIFTVASIVAATGSAGTTITFQGFNPTVTTCTTTAAAITSTGTLVVTGSWSPLCDNDNAYYLLNTVGGNGQLGGCPRCMTTANTPTRFVFTGPNQGKFCSSFNTKGVFGTPTSPMSASLAGRSCILIGVSDLGPGSSDTGKPMLSPVYISSVANPPLPLMMPNTAPQYNTLSITVASIFPTPNNIANPGRFNTNAILDYNPALSAGSGGTPAYKHVALDTQWGVPCSTPVISQPTNASPIPMQIVGGVVLRPPNTPQIGAGTCNTMSVFYNGGTGTIGGNGIAPDGYSSAIVTSLFLASVVPQPPPPAPPTPPAPIPRPAPAPAPFAPPPPNNGSAPGPSVSVTCIYSGQYLIESVVCPGKFMAFRNEASQCKNSTVLLRTTKQSEGNRKIWRLDATAVTGVIPTASSIIAVGRITSCPSTQVTYLASANGAPSPRLAGPGWKFIVTPVDAIKSCDTIHFQAVGKNPYTGKYLGYGSCSSQSSFKWESASASASIQWKLSRAK